MFPGSQTGLVVCYGSMKSNQSINLQKKLKDHLRSAKDKRDALSSSGVYRIPCTCDSVYIGTTKRSTNTRIKEHKASCRLGHSKKSTVAEHTVNNINHRVEFEEAQVIAPRLFRMNNFRSFIKKSLSTRPILTNSIIYGTLCTAAECSQQIVSKKVLAEQYQPMNYGTIGRYSIYGTCIGGPLISLWYRFLDKKIQGTTTKIVVKKLLVDQFTFTPVLLVIFYVSMSVMERKPDIFEECRNKFGETFKSSCMFWIPAQTINFMLIPPMYRVTYIGVCSFAWINILCCLKRK